ncbi:MAG TPA: hypothetical protein VF411_09250 [Bacteroidia bacterium]
MKTKTTSIIRFAVTLMLLSYMSAKAQFVVSDPVADANSAVQSLNTKYQTVLQSEQLTNVIEALRVAKQSYTTYVQIQQELALMKQQVQTNEARLHDLSQVNSINVNQVINVISRYSCLMGNNYYYMNGNYLNIAMMLLQGLVSCNNDALYLTTFSGMKKKMIDNNMWQSPINYSGNPGQDMFNINQQNQSFKQAQLQAYMVHDASQNAHQANTLDASAKMKALALSLDSLGAQCIKKSKDPTSNLSEYERVALCSKGYELHVQSTETINKAYQMEKEGTALSPVDAQTMLSVERNNLTQQCLIFRKY